MCKFALVKVAVTFSLSLSLTHPRTEASSSGSRSTCPRPRVLCKDPGSCRADFTRPSGPALAPAFSSVSSQDPGLLLINRSGSMTKFEPFCLAAEWFMAFCKHVHGTGENILGNTQAEEAN